MRLLMALAVIALLPAATAMEIAQPDPLRDLPVLEPTEVVLQVTIPCTEVLQAAAAGASPLVALTSKHTAAAGYTMTGTSTIVDAQACPANESRVVPLTLNLTASRDVRAEGEDQQRVEVQLGSDPSRTASTTFETSTAFFAHFEVRTTSALRQAAPQTQLTYPVTISYWSNGDAVFRFMTQGTDAGTIVLPDPVVGAAGHGNVTADVVYSTPFETGNNKADEGFTISIQAASAATGAPGDEGNISLLALTRGFYAPGPAAALPAALALAALVRRRTV